MDNNSSSMSLTQVVFERSISVSICFIYFLTPKTYLYQYHLELIYHLGHQKMSQNDIVHCILTYQMTNSH